MKLQEKMLRLSVQIQMGIEQLKEKCVGKLKDEEGASTVEYALLIAVIVVGVIFAASQMFKPLEAFFLAIVDKITKIAK